MSPLAPLQADDPEYGKYWRAPLAGSVPICWPSRPILHTFLSALQADDPEYGKYWKVPLAPAAADPGASPGAKYRHQWFQMPDKVAAAGRAGGWAAVGGLLGGVRSGLWAGLLGAPYLPSLQSLLMSSSNT